MDPLLLRAKTLLSRSSAFAGCEVSDLSHLAGDASTRQYVRLHLSGGEYSTAIMMILAGVKHPLGGGSRNLSQDDTFVELAGFFSAHGIPVPQLYIDGRPDGLLLVEDVGDVGLWQYPFGMQSAVPASPHSRDPVVSLYQRAIDILAVLQRIPHTPGCVAFERSCSFEHYLREASEFVLYFIPASRTFRRHDPEAISCFHRTLCEAVAAHPPVLSHYDYMSFNLTVDRQGAVRVLDFQEASLNSAARDLLALINDRDIDFALGRERHEQLLNYALKVLTRDPRLLDHYHQYLLHWCFRVAGRFVLLAENRGKPHYHTWIPGTLRRLGRTLNTPHALALPGADTVLEILTRACPEVREGADGLWPAAHA